MLKPIIFLISLLIAIPAATLANESEDLFIDADHQDIDYKEKTVHFAGNVVVKKGNISIYADELFVETNENGDSEKLVAKGNLAKFTQLGEGSLNISSEALTITYMVSTEVLTFNGQATFHQGGSKVTSDTIIFDLIAQRVKAAGDEAENGRVTTRLKVKQN